MLLLLSGEGATDIGYSKNSREGLCSPGQWEPGPMAYLAGEALQQLRPFRQPWLHNAYFISEHDLIVLSKEFDHPMLRGKRNSLYHSKMARTLGCVARHLASRTGRKVIPIFFRDGSGAGKFTPRDFNEIRASINGEKQGFRLLAVRTGVAMMPRPTSEVWLLCALQNNYQSCARLEDIPAKNAEGACPPKDMLAGCLKSRKREHADLPYLIRDIDCSKINMPSYNSFSTDLKCAVNICTQGDWCDPIARSLQVKCAQLINNRPTWFN